MQVTIPLGGTAPAVKLSPAMLKLYRVALLVGYVDPISDGRKTATIGALVGRGLLREAKGRTGRHYLTTTPAQVEADAYAENERRAAEAEAHADCPEQWMQADEDGTVRHVRQSRGGYPIEIEESGYGVWYVRINGRTPMTAGGTFEEARRAADRFERNQVHGEAYAEYREVTREARTAEPQPGPVGGMAQVGPEIDAMRADAAHYLGLRPSAAPSLADDVAALRSGIVDAYTPLSAIGLLAALDRIAAQVPQRAVDTLNGAPLWLHPGCGWVTNVQPGPVLTRCTGCKAHTDQWQALYVLPASA